MAEAEFGEWDRRLGWAFGLISEVPAERVAAQAIMVERHCRWRAALARYNEVWDEPDHPDHRQRLADLCRARAEAYPMALWEVPPYPLTGWGGFPYAMLYLRWHVRFPDEWYAHSRRWGTKSGLLQYLIRAVRSLSPAVLAEVEELIVATVRCGYRAEDEYYARLARLLDSPSLRAALAVAAADPLARTRTHAEYLLWLMDHPEAPHPQPKHWRAWLREREAVGGTA